MRTRKRIAVLSPAQNDGGNSLLQGIGRYKTELSSWDIFVSTREEINDCDEWLIENQWDGIISNLPTPELLYACLKRGVPCVDTSLESGTIPGIPKIGLDNLATGHLAGKHLLSLGYRFFAFCGCEHPLSNQRKAGFKEALLSANEKVKYFEFADQVSQENSIESHKGNHEEGAIEAIKCWILTLPSSIAIFACDDKRASQLEKACNRANIKIPNEIAILGVNNDYSICELSQTPLSSIDLNHITRGTLAAKTLQQMLANHSPVEDEFLVPPLEIVSRQSTDNAAINDDLVSRALSIIREGASAGLRVEDLVSKTRSSRRMLERKFKKHLGKTPNVVIREAQIAEIKRFLTHTDKSLAEIAYDTGFQNPEYMHVVFKREAGITPGAYRQRHLVDGYHLGGICVG